MRGALIGIVLAGCFAPSTPAGVPCDPVASHCPSGQRCVSSPDGFICATGDGTPTPDAALTDAAGFDAAIDAPSAPIQKTHTAAIAECTAPQAPSTQACRAANGNAQLVIDLNDSSAGVTWQSFLRFDPDAALPGRVITKVVLRLVVTNAANAPGPDSGSVFLVQPFTLASLSVTAPETTGAMLAGSVGAVDNNDVVTITLPNTIVDGTAPIYLGLFPNDDDGVNYFNLDGSMPPQLIVDAQ